LNFIAAGVWATVFASAGFLLSKAFEAVLGEVARTFGLLMLAVFLTAIWAVLQVRKRRKQRRTQSENAKLNAPAAGDSIPGA
jgi:membrane protein DedA with SNARE-associated domain